jgi:hypothetical protein
MEASAPTPSTMSSDLFQTPIPAEEVCEYTFKVELLEKNKISLIVFNTTTGIKYQTHIEEYSDNWEDLKINFQHNFSLFYKMFNKALIEKDPSFTVNVLHKIDYVILQVSYINDLLGFTVDISVNQYKKDNLQESFNIMEYKQKQLEDENKSLKTEIKTIHNELTELKRIINLLGDGFSYDNRLHQSNVNLDMFNDGDDELNIFKRGLQWNRGHNREAGGASNIYDIDWPGKTKQNFIPAPEAKPHTNDRMAEPFINVVVANKLSIKLFHEIIEKNKLPYDVKLHGYQWVKLQTMMKEHGIEENLDNKWKRIFMKTQAPWYNYDIDHFTYDFTWKSFKELFDITI